MNQESKQRVRWELIVLGGCMVATGALFASGLKSLGDGIAEAGSGVSTAGENLTVAGDSITVALEGAERIGLDLITAAGKIENASSDYSKGVAQLSEIQTR